MIGIRILECVKDLKMKNTEGYDRIPQRILLDGIEVLIEPLTQLFKMVYRDQAIPGQWLISKIIPVHKKGEKVMIENYRPVDIVRNFLCQCNFTLKTKTIMSDKIILIY